ncbi:hypothetical protein HUN39_09965 [Methylocystis sp. FS]|uniref:hypothetical protein n=1 Tax=Methylocystis silviterrae TaxID=2743612 RepID=UPI00158240A3|nr:hypothetical protein [Methylocystis silviterrae]NUJ80352.1 hypothetical protein [Methylocystis silviterrae]
MAPPFFNLPSVAPIRRKKTRDRASSFSSGMKRRLIVEMPARIGNGSPTKNAAKPITAQRKTPAARAGVL